MPSDPSETIYTVVVTGVREESTKKKVAQTITAVSDRLPMDRVLVRLDSLPWTLTRKATLKKAVRLVKLLEGLGAHTRCIPPLPGTAKYDPSETQILPGTELLTQTQVMSATQFLAAPEETESPPEPKPEEAVSQPQPRVKPAEASIEPAKPKPAPAVVRRPPTSSPIWRVVIWILVVVTLAAGLAGGVIFFIDYLAPVLWH